MRNKLEHILLSILLGLSVLLGLSFWLNTKFGFNIFLKSHWDELAQLQATNTPINQWFYVSIGVAVFIFLLGLLVINIPFSKNNKNTTYKPVDQRPAQIPTPIIKEETKTLGPIPEPIATPFARPPRLNLPKNMAEFVEKKHNETQEQQQQNTYTTTQHQYDEELAKIFNDAGYIVKPKPTISGFTPNLFAIGNNEVVWIGGIDCKSEDLKKAVQKLKSVFEDTLSDIPINVYPFIVDNSQTVTPDESILIVPSIDVLKNFISENPADSINEDEKESFDSYSEYIDTIIQYIKNL